MLREDVRVHRLEDNPPKRRVLEQLLPLLGWNRHEDAEGVYAFTSRLSFLELHLHRTVYTLTDVSCEGFECSREELGVVGVVSKLLGHVQPPTSRVVRQSPSDSATQRRWRPRRGWSSHRLL